jgi:S1-C subfamily serine protease
VASAGVLKSLDQEMTALVTKTEPYLVTVKGDGGWRNLIATGIVIDSTGVVVTSSQVYAAEKIEVTFKNGKSYPARKIGVDNLTGLAILKINAGKFAGPKPDRPHKLSGGAWIVVVGNSFGVPATVNFGNYECQTEEGFLRLLVNASPGSSGAAIIDIDGNLIGILVAMESEYPAANAGSNSVNYTSNQGPYPIKLLNGLGTPVGRCLAVPIEMAKGIACQIIRNGKVSRGYLGISTKNLPDNLLNSSDANIGVEVNALDPGSPAEKAGLSKGDIITYVDSTRIINRALLYSLVRSHRAGDSLNVRILREKKKLEITVLLGEAKDDLYLSNLKQPALSSNSNTSNNLTATSPNWAQSEISNLKSEIKELRTEIDKLKTESSK